MGEPCEILDHEYFKVYLHRLSDYDSKKNVLNYVIKIKLQNT